jgi:hypothetical protein
VLAAFVSAPLADAHPRAKGYARGFESKVVAVQPEVDGLDVRVVGGDDRLRLENTSATEVVVLGYDGEPYLRIGRNGSFHNVRSPASYLNRDRFARVSVPLSADPGAGPVWKRLSPHGVWQWHDHRIQWMAAGPPPAVRDRPDVRHAIFEWRVPARIGTRSLTVAGRLDYVPPADDGASSALVAAVVITGVGAALGFGLLLLRLHRREEATAEPVP